MNVCATGPGQTPFIATTSATTNFNGFNIRCRGECNATVTVNVTGGSGNFTYSWLGGPGTATWTTACGGPQIVIVTDVRQGVSCGVTLNLSEPAPLGVTSSAPAPAHLRRCVQRLAHRAGHWWCFWRYGLL
ncbi:MAG: SprB repeat-containing protein [Flavobacteriales bacterium]|nr:SprB repeat-containing protein [Flavobacteriales bacterium]